MQVQKPRNGYKLVKSLFGKYEEIPEEWELENLTNLNVKTSSGGTPSRENSNYYTGKNSWIKSGELKDRFLSNSEEKITDEAIENSSAKIFPKNTVLVAMYGATIGKTAILEKDASTNQAICAIPPNKKFDSVFLQQFLIQKRNILVSLGMGAGQPNISQELIKNFKYLVPPLKEQQKIASMLSNVDSLINQTQKEIEATQKLKKGLMQKLLTRGIGHKKFKKVKSLFGKYEEIPEEWNCFKLNQVCKKISVGIATSTTKYFVDKGVPLLRNQNIKRGYIDTSDLIYISEEFARMNESKKLLQGDVVSMRTGYPGQSAVVTKIMEGWQTFTTLIFRPNHEILSSHYLAVFLNSFGRKQITSSQAGAAQQNLNAGWASNLLILFPPILEQQKIASILSNIDLQIQKQQEYKSKLESLKKGLMQKLLTGQIRVRT